MNTYGSRIKAARESANLTQEGLGQKLGVTGVTIMRYEKNQREPRQDQFKRLAAALNVDVNWLMNGYTLEQRDQGMKDYVARRFTEAELDKRLRDSYIAMTVEGKRKVADYAEDILPRYSTETTPQPPPAPQEGTDTTPPQDGAEGPQEGE